MLEPKTSSTCSPNLQLTPKAIAPMNRICIDIVGPLIESRKGNTHILTVYDPFSHWPSAYPIAKTDANTVLTCLKHHITQHSVPAEVLSDRGKNLMAGLVREFLQDMGAKKFETTPYKPSTNGSVERFHAYLASAISHAIDNSQTDWDEHIDSVLFAYRTTPIDGLDVSPFEVIYGRDPNLPIDNILFRENYTQPATTLQQFMDFRHENYANMFEVITRTRKERFERNKKAAGLHKGIPIYNIDDKVYLSFAKGHFRPLGGTTKLSPLNDGPYTVVEKLLDGLVYKVQHDRKG